MQGLRTPDPRSVRSVVELDVHGARADAVVVTCDSGDLVFDAVAALFAEREIARIVIVDNASRPEFRTRLQALEGSRVALVLADRNRGFAAGVNIGLARTTAPMVAIVNPDCVVEPGSIASLVEALDSNPDAGVVGGLVVDPCGREHEGARRDLPSRRHALGRWLGLRGTAWRFNHAGTPLPETAIDVAAVSGAYMAVRRACLGSVGGLDERFRLHFEDLDWCARFRRAGRRVMFVPHAKAIHAKGTSSASRPIAACFHKHRSMVLFDRLHAVSPWERRTRWLFAAGVWFGCGLAMAAEAIRARSGRDRASRRVERVRQASSHAASVGSKSASIPAA